MAYVNKEKKAKIAAALKTVMPKDWKYSLAVNNHSTIVLTVRSAPIDLVEMNGGHRSVNTYHYKKHFEGELLTTIDKIVDALNTDNFDKSDIQSDYFHVGHYVDFQFGTWDKAFTVAEK